MHTNQKYLNTTKGWSVSLRPLTHCEKCAGELSRVLVFLPKKAFSVQAFIFL